MGRQWQTDANALSRKLHLAFICIGAYRSVAIKAGSTAEGGRDTCFTLTCERLSGFSSILALDAQRRGAKRGSEQAAGDA